jgi:hypothetical protein
MPFHSLHYCIHPFAVSAIAQVRFSVHARVCDLLRSLQSYASDAHARAIVKSGATCMKARRVTVLPTPINSNTAFTYSNLLLRRCHGGSKKAGDAKAFICPLRSVHSTL